MEMEQLSLAIQQMITISADEQTTLLQQCITKIFNLAGAVDLLQYAGKRAESGNYR